MHSSNLSRRSLLLLSLGSVLTGCGLASAGPETGAVGGLNVPPSDSKGKNGKANKVMTNTEPAAVKVPEGKEIATLGAGCFWCVEAIFLDLKGVDKVVSGYSGGKAPNPTYEEVCSGTTGHAEVVQITFDPKVISFSNILRIFFTTHDPTTLNQQGADVGTQYRSAIFYHSAEQKKAVEKVIQEITAEKLYPNRIVTEVTPYPNFYPAEGYHQNYFALNPNQGYCRAVIEPKVRKFREKYRQLLKK